MEKEEEESHSTGLTLNKQLLIDNIGPDTTVEDLTNCFRSVLKQCAFKTRPEIQLATDKKGRQLGYATITVPVSKVDLFLNFDGWYVNKRQLKVSMLEMRNVASTWHTAKTGVYQTSVPHPPLTSAPPTHPHRLVDGGIYLTSPKYKTPEDIVVKALGCGVDKLVTLGTSVYHSREGLKLSRLFSGTVFCTAGVSPRNAVFWTDETESQLEEVLQCPECVAVGPCGFDLSTDDLLTSCDQQLQAFEKQLQLASRLKKPVLVTETKALTEVTSLLTTYKSRLPKVAIVSRPEEADAFTSYMELGCFYFVSGEILDSTSALWRCLKARYQQEYKTDKLLLASKAPHRDGPKSSTTRDVGPNELPSVVKNLGRHFDIDEEELCVAMRGYVEEFYWGGCETREDEQTTPGSVSSSSEVQSKESDTADSVEPQTVDTEVVSGDSEVTDDSKTKISVGCEKVDQDDVRHSESLVTHSQVSPPSGQVIHSGTVPDNKLGEADDKLGEADDTPARSRSDSKKPKTNWTYRIVLWSAFLCALLAIYFYDFS